MKEFRLFDREWIQKHITVENGKQESQVHLTSNVSYTRKDTKLTVNFNDLVVVETYSILSANDLVTHRSLRDIPSFAYLIFKDIKTKEYFYLDLHNEEIKNAYHAYSYDSTLRPKYVSEFILTHIIKAWYPTEYIWDLTNIILHGLEYDNISNSDIVRDWLLNSLKINKDSITHQGMNYVIAYCKSFALPQMQKHRTKLISKAINGEVSDRELDNYIDMKKDFIVRKLEENRNRIYVKYVLFRNDIAFSGHYDIKFMNEKRGSKGQRIFDAIAIDVGIMGGVQAAKQSILDHKDEVLKTLWTILKEDPMCSMYAKYMRLTQLRILGDGCLFAQFDFKEGLREVCEAETII